MPSLADHHSANTTKILFLGLSGSGKTGALASLADANYKLFILDLDNGVDLLRKLILQEGGKYKKEAIKNINYMTLTEVKQVMSDGKIVPKDATVWPRAAKLMSKWQDGDTNYGAVSTWDDKTVLVLDSLTALGDAAYDYVLKMNGKLQSGATGFEYQRFIGMAQDMVFSFLELLVDESIKCNVIINTHVTFVDEPGMVRATPDQFIPQVGFPSALGKALPVKIPRLFNRFYLRERQAVAVL